MNGYALRADLLMLLDEWTLEHDGSRCVAALEAARNAERLRGAIAVRS